MTAATPLARRLPNASRLVSQLRRNALVPCAGDARSHARQEFSSLEAWLSAPSTLKLPLHQIERQQQTKGREVQRLLLQAHRNVEVMETWVPLCVSGKGTTKCCTRIAGSAPAPSRPSSERSRLCAWVIPTRAPTASIPWMQRWLCQRVCSLTSCKDG